jgi:hypothetical protein
VTIVEDPVARAIVLQVDFDNVVETPTGGYVQVEVTIEDNVLKFYSSSSGGGGAPTDAEYLVAASEDELSAERVTTNTATISWDHGTAGQAKANVVAGSIGVSQLDTTVNALIAVLFARPVRYYFHAFCDTSFGPGAHPSTEQFLDNSSRNVQLANLATFNQVRVGVRVTTASGSANSPRFVVKYKTGAFSGTVGSYSDIGTSEVAASLASTGVIVSSWIALAAGATADDIQLTMTQVGGDSSATPATGSIWVEFRYA